MHKPTMTGMSGRWSLLWAAAACAVLSAMAPGTAAAAAGKKAGHTAIKKPAPEVEGVALYRERIALPPNAVFEARLQDTSRADAPAVLLGRHVIEPVRRMPIAFRIPYDPAAIQPQGRYAVRGEIRVDGKLWFTTDTHYAVLSTPEDKHVELLLRRVASSDDGNTAVVRPQPLTWPKEPAPNDASAPHAALLETYWKLVSIGGQGPVKSASPPQEAHLVLEKDKGRIHGSGGCNRLMGGYELQDNKLSFKQVASTMMACQQGSDTEAAFLPALGRVTHYQIQQQRLLLLDEQDQPLLQFEAVPLR